MSVLQAGLTWSWKLRPIFLSKAHLNRVMNVLGLVGEVGDVQERVSWAEETARAKALSWQDAGILKN